MPNTTMDATQTAVTPLVRARAFAEIDEQELIAQAKCGIEAAFEQLVERYERRVFRLALNITHNREDAEDVAQNAFVQAFRNLSKFRGDSRFYTWLVRITVNEALMRVRRRRPSEVSADDSTETDESVVPRQLEDWGPNPEERYRQEELRRILASTISKLEPGYRTVFELRDVEGLSTEETAQTLALTSSAVKTRLRRARITLRGSLKKHFRSIGASRNQRSGASRYSEAFS